MSLKVKLSITIKQIKSIYKSHEHTPCPLTERLVTAGYQQTLVDILIKLRVSVLRLISKRIFAIHLCAKINNLNVYRYGK